MKYGLQHWRTQHWLPFPSFSFHSDQCVPSTVVGRTLAWPMASTLCGIPPYNPLLLKMCGSSKYNVHSCDWVINELTLSSGNGRLSWAGPLKADEVSDRLICWLLKSKLPFGTMGHVARTQEWPLGDESHPCQQPGRKTGPQPCAHKEVYLPTAGMVLKRTLSSR